MRVRHSGGMRDRARDRPRGRPGIHCPGPAGACGQSYRGLRQELFAAEFGGDRCANCSRYDDNGEDGGSANTPEVEPPDRDSYE